MVAATMTSCCICGRETETPYDTPADPPFFPVEGGKHCEDCEHWLETGELNDFDS